MEDPQRWIDKFEADLIRLRALPTPRDKSEAILRKAKIDAIESVVTELKRRPCLTS